MHRIALTLLPLAALVAPFAFVGDAQAGIGACGNIHVEAEAECEVKGGIECEGQCTPVSFEAQCAANLQVECAGECNLEATAECSGSCEADCQAECDINPGELDCRGECVGSCEADCSGRCGADSSGSECYASCQANCEGSCSASCEATPPSADCSGKCEASCEGRCEASANLDCQVDCQAEGYVGCKAELEGGCKIDCDAEKGALFCDGQWVDHGGNLDECVDSLRALLDIEVEGYAEGSCDNNSCEGTAGGSISCAMEPDHGRTGALLGALGLMVVGFAARRRTA